MAGVLDILRQALTLDIQSVAKRNEFVNLATVAIGREQAEMGACSWSRALLRICGDSWTTAVRRTGRAR
jgi:hypothetical protein